MNRKKIIVLGILILILFGTTGYLINKNPKVGKWINIPQAPNEKCRPCTDVWDESCPGNSSCVILSGVSSGVCLPVPKMGQSYTNDQINQICRTSFPESTDAVNDEKEAITRARVIYPEVKNIKRTTDAIGQTMNISARQTDLGWNLMFWQGSGDCPAGCINDHYWYFTVYKNGKVEKIGEYEKIYNSRKNAPDETGSPIWDFLEKD